MDPKVLWILAVAVAVIVLVLAWVASRQDRRRRLRRAASVPEYERVVQQAGSARKAEAALEARARRVGALHIRPLPEEEARGFAGRWRQTQARFVDAPQGAVGEADALVNEVMAARGYPLGDFDQRADDISVDHPHVVSHYRAARDLRRDAGSRQVDHRGSPAGPGALPRAVRRPARVEEPGRTC